MFRFPLRTRDNYEDPKQRLSQNIYTIDKVIELIEALKSEAKLLLIFLRSITTIEVYNIDNSGKQTLFFQTKISDASVTEFKQKRSSFLSDLKSSH